MKKALTIIILVCSFNLYSQTETKKDSINKSYQNPIDNKTYKTSGEFKTYQSGNEVDSVSKGIKETKLEKVVFLSGDKELKENSSIEVSKKPGKIMIQFELLKEKNEIKFAVRDDLDLAIMKEFEKRVLNEKYPNSKKNPIKLQLIYKVYSLND